MHIQNLIRGYILAQYGECDLLHEFSHYSFFTQGFIADTFNVVNNEAWSNGKRSFLCLIDKLIDFAETEEIVNSIDWRRNIIKWFILSARLSFLVRNIVSKAERLIRVSRLPTLMAGTVPFFISR